MTELGNKNEQQNLDLAFFLPPRIAEVLPPDHPPHIVGKVDAGSVLIVITEGNTAVTGQQIIDNFGDFEDAAITNLYKHLGIKNAEDTEVLTEMPVAVLSASRINQACLDGGLIAIRKDLQDQGIGSALYERLLDYARKHHYEIVIGFHYTTQISEPFIRMGNYYIYELQPAVVAKLAPIVENNDEGTIHTVAILNPALVESRVLPEVLLASCDERLVVADKFQQVLELCDAFDYCITRFGQDDAEVRIHQALWDSLCMLSFGDHRLAPQQLNDSDFVDKMRNYISTVKLVDFNILRDMDITMIDDAQRLLRSSY